MIALEGLTKRYGDKTAVDGLTFTVEPGRVTGFLGPNGAGKSTTMRMILGLDRPDGGSVTVNSRDYVHVPLPMREVGALLDARAVHGTRTARNHLRWLAHTNAIPEERVDEVVRLVGLESVARKRSGTFSLGMSQRLGIAAALLGDPKVLLFDEPVNGLDPEGIKWIRELMRGLADDGRTVEIGGELHARMDMHRTFRLSRRSRGVEPKRHVVCGGWRCVRLGFVGADQVLEQAITKRIVSRNNDVFEVWALFDQFFEFRKQRVRYNETFRAAICQHETIVVFGQQGVHRNGDDARLQTTQKGGRPICGIEQRQQHTFFTFDA